MSIFKLRLLKLVEYPESDLPDVPDQYRNEPENPPSNVNVQAHAFLLSYIA